MPGVHSSLAPSAAKQWVNCPGSVRLGKQLPDEPSSSYADEGSAAHELGALALQHMRGELMTDQKVGDPLVTKLGHAFPDFPKFPVTHEMVEAVREYVDFVRALEAKGLMYVHIEHKLIMDWVHKDLYGTADFFAYEPKANIVHVVDYKHGKGVSVPIEDNYQLMTYGLGALLFLNGKAVKNLGNAQVHLVIIQPRVFGEDTIRECTIPADKLRDWGLNVLKTAAVLSDDPNAPRKAGDHCTWCKALATCPEHRAMALSLAGVDDKVMDVSNAPNLVLPDPATMSPEQTLRVMDILATWTSWATKVKAFAQSQAEMGVQFPGYKMVKGKATRVWVSPAAAEAAFKEALGNNAYTLPAFRSVAQIEKALKTAKIFDANTFQGFWEKPDKGLSLVKDSDPRKAVIPQMLNDNLDSLALFGGTE